MPRQHKPARTCIGCRAVRAKDEVVRIVGGPAGIVLDYREKLPGRAAYICPERPCIDKAFRDNVLSRALKLRVQPPRQEDFIDLLNTIITEKIKGLIAIALKAGKIAAGFSAVRDGLEKNRVEMLLFAVDLASGTREKIDLQERSGLRTATLFARDELGRMFNRESIGVVAFEDKGLADAVWRETQRLKSLIKDHE